MPGLGPTTRFCGEFSLVMRRCCPSSLRVGASVSMARLVADCTFYGEFSAASRS